MNLHEYQSKRLFARYAIPVPKGEVADSPEGAVAEAAAAKFAALEAAGITTAHSPADMGTVIANRLRGTP